MSEQYGINTDWLLTGEGEKFLPGRNFPAELETQPIEIIDGGEKKFLHGRNFEPAGGAGGSEAKSGTAVPLLKTQQSEIIDGGENFSAPGAENPPRPAPAAPAGAPDLAAQLVAALRENAALLRELGDLRVREVEQRVELERLRAELSSARARCALLEEREREREDG